MKKPSLMKHHERQKKQQFIVEPYEIITRAEEMLLSDDWADITAGLALLTGRRLTEICKHGNIQPKSLYSVLFSGQLKSDLDEVAEYEIPTLIEADRVLAAWQKLRTLRDFSDIASDSIHSSFGRLVKEVVIRILGDLIPPPDGRSTVYTHLGRGVYPRLSILFFLPRHVSQVAYVAHLLGLSKEEAGEVVPNYDTALYYMRYKIVDDAGVVDGREGIRSSDAGVEVLDVFKLSPQESKMLYPQERKVQVMAEMAEIETTETDEIDETEQVSGSPGKLRVKHPTKTEFEAEQKMMGGKMSADEAVLRMTRDHKIYREYVSQLSEWKVSMDAILELLAEASDVALNDETVLDCLSAALADKRRFRESYKNRFDGSKDQDFSAMTLEELKHARGVDANGVDASHARWKRGVDLIIEYNNKIAIPELRWFINATTVKQLIGGKGTEIKKYLESHHLDAINAHHEKHGLKSSNNRARTNIRERVLGDSSPLEDNEE
jgi:hypothetical protein